MKTSAIEQLAQAILDERVTIGSEHFEDREGHPRTTMRIFVEPAKEEPPHPAD